MVRSVECSTKLEKDKETKAKETLFYGIKGLARILEGWDSLQIRPRESSRPPKPVSSLSLYLPPIISSTCLLSHPLPLLPTAPFSFDHLSQFLD